MIQTEVSDIYEVSLEGDLRTANLSQIKHQLLGELSNLQRLRVRISNVHALDLPTLQWVYAFGCAANSEGKEVTIKMDLPAELDQLVRTSGLRDMFHRFDR